MRIFEKLVCLVAAFVQIVFNYEHNMVWVFEGGFFFFFYSLLILINWFRIALNVVYTPQGFG